MITLNTLVNLAVLHIIRVVVMASRGEKVSCMYHAVVIIWKAFLTRR